MNLSLEGKNALICGSSQGIGYAIAQELALMGANCILLARNEENLKLAVNELDISIGQLHSYHAIDLADRDALKNLVKEILAKAPIHILINNSGGPAAGPIVNATEEQFLQAFQQHLLVNHFLTTSLMERMKAEGYGRIINIISTSVKIPLKNLGVSNTIRGAVASWAKTMANELAQFGITVNNVLPGYTRTSRLDSLVQTIAKGKNISTEDVEKEMIEDIPAKRFGEAAEVAALAAFLATPAAAYINGTSIPVDGGRTAQFNFDKMNFQNTLPFAQGMDAIDPLRRFRNEFLLPSHGDGDAIYFLGNSLGLQPRRTKAAIEEVLQQWNNLGVESFFKGEKPWLNFHQRLQPMLSKIVGALPHEVVAMNSLTVNCHLMMASFYQPVGNRNKILCEAKAFPSDQYMLHSHIKGRGLNPDDVMVEVQPTGEVIIHEEDILAAIDQHKENIALLFFGGVNYYTGQVFNMQELTKAARSAGAKVGFDLAHAAGNVPLQLHDWHVDFACWCSYKYLNSGPGGIGGAFVHERHHRNETLQRFAGWWGNKRETQFRMEKTFVPEPSAEGWQLSTPSPVLYAAHKAALDVVEEAGLQNVFQKNEDLNNYLRFVLAEVKKELPNESFKIFTPQAKEESGCQISLSVQNGKKVFEYLSDNGVFADWREPDVIRVAPVGLYNTFEEVWRFGQCLKAALLTFAS